MTQNTPTQIWNPQACIPKKDIVEGKFLQAELALDLHTIANGTAKPPYNNPASFFHATHPTKTLKQLLKDTLSHLSGAKTINPVLVFDAGFGGGKTHAMAAIYYAVKNSGEVEIKEILGKTAAPEKTATIVIAGDEYGGKGVQRGEYNFRTLWADLLYQLGETELAKETDNPEGLPDRQTITKLLQKQPTLILIDELPKYLDLVKNQLDLLNRVKHFIHTLTLSVCETENSILILSVASDAYIDAADAVRRELTEAMNILNRKMQSIEPVKSEDVPYILKKRLFDLIDPTAARTTAEAYTQLYETIKAPDRYRRAEYRERIEETYPFHPDLIDVLYERLSTLPDFQRTRGALRLLAQATRKIWQDKEKDGFLIHPYHIDLSVSEIVQELTTRLKEDKYANAIASDVYRHEGRKAKAQQKDEDYKSHFKAPLFRRACNAIYLYSLIGGREEAKGIDLDTLVAGLATPTKEEHVQWYKDQVLPTIGETFWYIEPIGNRFVFRREPGENRIIDQEAQNVPAPRAIKIVYDVLRELFTNKGKTHFYIEIFPDDPSKLTDDTTLKVAVLNPLIGHTIPSEQEVPSNISQFILNRDARGNLRTYRNNVFLLAAKEGAWETLRDTAARLEVSRDLAKDPEKYGIPHEKKKSLEQKVAQYESTINNDVRAVFTYLVYATKDGKIEAKTIRPSGYGTAMSGQELLWHVLSDVLHRVVNEPLDPDYVKLEAWPHQAVETTTRTLYENIHRKTGIVLPENQSLFEQTILEGTKRGTWVLLQQGQTYAPEKVPARVIISSDSQLLLPDEAGKQNLTDPRGHLCEKCLSWPCKCGKKPVIPSITDWGPTGPRTPETTVFDMMQPKIQLEDLDKWIRREGIDTLSEASIRISGTTDAAPQFRNLVRLARAGKRATATVKTTVKVYEPNLTLDCTFKADDKSLDTAASKILDDMAKWSLPNFEAEITLKAEKFPVNELKELLKNTLKIDDPDIKLGLELKPIKVK